MGNTDRAQPDEVAQAIALLMQKAAERYAKRVVESGAAVAYMEARIIERLAAASIEAMLPRTAKLVVAKVDHVIANTDWDVREREGMAEDFIIRVEHSDKPVDTGADDG